MNIPNPYAAVITLVLDWDGARIDLEMTMTPECSEEPRMSNFECDVDGVPSMKFTGCIRASTGWTAILNKAAAIRDLAKNTVPSCHHEFGNAFLAFQIQMQKWKEDI